MKRFSLLLLAFILVLSTLLTAQASAADAINASSGGIRFTRKTLVVYIGECYDMVSFLRDKATGSEVDADGITWKSSKKSCVLIGQNDGEALAMKPGTATITAIRNRKKATIKLIVKRNKLDKIYGGKPSLSVADYNDYELVLKSIDITAPDVVVCEYYLINNYPSKKIARYFSKFYAYITAYDTYYEERMTIVDGSPVMPIRVNCRGQRVKVFKAVFKYDDVKHTDIALVKSGRNSIQDYWNVTLQF